ncbi:MAG: glycosyltransferase family 2 protein [Candidatus Omnitrophota bacterium]|jgi:GT2 family glycosyltransferase
MIKKDLVSSVVLNWNGKDIILPCLRSLLAQTYLAHEIILVDNGSSDGSFELIEQEFRGRLVILRHPKNLGFAEGVNTGAAHSRGEFLALLNSDAVADKNWLEELVRKMKSEDAIGMCASKVYLADRQGILDNTGELLGRDGLNRTRGRLEEDRGQYDSSHDVLAPSGCAALYRRNMFDQIGGFDKYFFAYGDDMDLGLRGRMRGYRAAYVPKAIVYHKLSASAGVVSSFKAYHVERNRLWIVLRCFPLRHLVFSPLYTAVRYFYSLCGLLNKKGPAAQFAKKSSPLALIAILLKVYLSTLLFLPYLLRERSKIQKTSRWKYPEFEDCFRRYGLSARDAALREVL